MSPWEFRTLAMPTKYYSQALTTSASMSRSSKTIGSIDPPRSDAFPLPDLSAPCLTQRAACGTSRLTADDRFGFSPTVGCVESRFDGLFGGRVTARRVLPSSLARALVLAPDARRKTRPASRSPGSNAAARRWSAAPALDQRLGPRAIPGSCPHRGICRGLPGGPVSLPRRFGHEPDLQTLVTPAQKSGGADTGVELAGDRT